MLVGSGGRPRRLVDALRIECHFRDGRIGRTDPAPPASVRCCPLSAPVLPYGRIAPTIQDGLSEPNAPSNPAREKKSTGPLR